jgi:hypothetical protein
VPGPVPRPNARRRGISHVVWLPADGRPDPAPEWPLEADPGTVGDKIWAQVWTLPQATVWEKQQMHRLIARWVLLLVECEQPGVRAAKLSELRQLEDRIGANPSAMARLRWQVDDGQSASVTPINEKTQRRLVLDGRGEVVAPDEWRPILGDGDAS